MNQMESVSDFKARIALMKRNAENTGKRWSMVGASRANPSVLRKTTNKGHMQITMETPSVIARALALIRLFRSKHSHFNVKPRYTCGSPAAVSQEEALHQINEELISIEHDLEGAHGDEHQARARKLGLGPAREGAHKCPNCCFIQPDPMVTHCVACTWRLDTSVNDGSHYSPVELVVEHRNHWMAICLMTGEIFTRPFAYVDPRKVEGCKKCREANDKVIGHWMEGSY